MTVECENALLGRYQRLLFLDDFNADPNLSNSQQTKFLILIYMSK